MALPLPASLLVSAGLVWAGLLIHLTGLGTAHMADAKFIDDIEHGEGRLNVTRTGSMGMFQMCVDGDCEAIPPNEFLGDYYKASQAMTLLGMFCSLMSAAMTVVGCLVARCLNKRLPRIFAVAYMVGGIASLTFTIICVVTWEVEFYAKIVGAPDMICVSHGYSFAFVLVGPSLVLIGSAVFCVGSYTCWFGYHLVAESPPEEEGQERDSAKTSSGNTGGINLPLIRNLLLLW